ncbi:MAG: hypothetical protein VYE77_04540 [Planctomycetota bacterium]|nr:hypothetical protein [Planctomycetota bacterium]
MSGFASSRNAQGDAAQRVLAFARRVRAARWWTNVVRFSWVVGLSSACVAALLLWWSVSAALWWLLGAACLTLLAAVVAGSAVARAERRLDEDLAAAPLGLGDGLRTWFEEQRHGRGTQGMASWLCEDLAGKVSDRAALVAGGRVPLRVRWQRLGRARLLLPVLLVLLLAWWLGQLFSLPIPGPQQAQTGGGQSQAPQVTPSGPGVAVVVPDSGDGDPEPGDGDDGESSPPPAQEAPRPDAPPDPDRPDPDQPDPDQPGETPPPEEPAPLLDLPSLPTAIVPDFVGDGPVRQQLAERALAGRDDAADPDQGDARQSQPENAPGSSQPNQPGRGASSPEANDETFERAAERAARSRHVPASERAMVRRFFERLREEGK